VRRILIRVRSGIRTGPSTRWGTRKALFADPHWLRPGWSVEQVGVWGVVATGPEPKTIDELVNATEEMPPLVFRVVGEHERINLRGEPHIRNTVENGRITRSVEVFE